MGKPKLKTITQEEYNMLRANQVLLTRRWQAGHT
jgi:hypothetical protein